MLSARRAAGVIPPVTKPSWFGDRGEPERPWAIKSMMWVTVGPACGMAWRKVDRAWETEYVVGRVG